MIFTKRADYGLRAAMELVACYQRGPLSAHELATRSDLPEPFVKKLLQRLTAAGVARSVRGRGGGYYLAKRPQQISLGRVLEAFEDLAPVSCLEHAYLREGEGGVPCALELLEAKCPTQAAWALVDRRVRAALDAITLADLLEEVRARGLALGKPANG